MGGDEPRKSSRLRARQGGAGVVRDHGFRRLHLQRICRLRDDGGFLPCGAFPDPEAARRGKEGAALVSCGAVPDRFAVRPVPRAGDLPDARTRASGAGSAWGVPVGLAADRFRPVASGGVRQEDRRRCRGRGAGLRRVRHEPAVLRQLPGLSAGRFHSGIDRRRNGKEGSAVPAGTRRFCRDVSRSYG